MVQIKYPLVLIIMILPYLVYYFWPMKEPSRRPIRLPSIPIVKSRSPRISLILVIMSVLSYIFLTLAVSRPVYLRSPVLVKKENYSIMMAVDVSISMSLKDMPVGTKRVSRLEVLKKEIKNFVSQRPSDDFGMIIFGEKAYVMSPLTSDHVLFNSLVDELDTSFAGSLTSIGEAIILAGQTLNNTDSTNHILILLTDGRDTLGTISPDDAIAYALSNNLKIYTIGFGSANNNNTENLNIDALNKIATQTGGKFFRATDPASLSRIYENIHATEQKTVTEKYFQNIYELYYIPLLLSLLLSFGAAYILRRHYE